MMKIYIPYHIYYQFQNPQADPRIHYSGTMDPDPTPTIMQSSPGPLVLVIVLLLWIRIRYLLHLWIRIHNTPQRVILEHWIWIRNVKPNILFTIFLYDFISYNTKDPDPAH